MQRDNVRCQPTHAFSRSKSGPKTFVTSFIDLAASGRGILSCMYCTCVGTEYTATANAGEGRRVWLRERSLSERVDGGSSLI